MGKQSQVATRSPEREALAAAIAHRAEMQVEQTKLATAAAGAESRVHAARAAVESATENLKTAKAAAIDYEIAAATGVASDAPPTIDAARQRIVSAEDALEVARSTRDALKERLAAYRMSLSTATDRVTRTAREILRQSPSVAAALEAAEASQRKMVDANAALFWLVSEGVADGVSAESSRLLARFRYLTKPGLGMNPEIWAVLVRDSSIPGGTPWQAALTALCADADAPLP